LNAKEKINFHEKERKGGTAQQQQQQKRLMYDNHNISRLASRFG